MLGLGGGKQRSPKSTSENTHHRTVLAGQALVSYLPYFSVLVLCAMFTLSMLPSMWKEAGDVSIDESEIIVYFIGTITATIVLVLSLLQRDIAKKYGSALLTLLAAVMFLTLATAFIHDPAKTWEVGIATMAMVGVGALLPTKGWVLANIGLGWLAFALPSFFISLLLDTHDTVIFWRTYTTMLLFASFSAFFIHRYVYTYIGSLSGITEEAIVNAESDKLTGLLNRTGLENVYTVISGQTAGISSSHAQTVENFKEQGTLGMMFLDMNGLKKINDTYGHVEGDKAICLVGDALRASTRWGKDICARWGGDEFIVLTAGGILSAEILQKRMDEWLEKNAKDIVPFPVAVTVGEPVFITSGTTLDYVVNLADEHMYKNKPNREGATRHTNNSLDETI